MEPETGIPPDFSGTPTPEPPAANEVEAAALGKEQTASADPEVLLRALTAQWGILRASRAAGGEAETLFYYRQLVELQQQLLASLAHGIPLWASSLDGQRPRAWVTAFNAVLQGEQQYLDALLLRHDLPGRRRAGLLEDFRDAVAYWLTVADVFEGKPVPEAGLTTLVQVRRVQEKLTPNHWPRSTLPIVTRRREEAGVLERQLVERRLRAELLYDQTEAAPDAVACWSRRTALGGAQGKLRTLPAPADGGDHNVASQLSTARTTLLTQAEDYLRTAPLDERVQQWTELTSLAQSSSNEISTHLEGMAPAAAVINLELVQEDLRELIGIGERLLATIPADEEALKTDSAERLNVTRKLYRWAGNELHEKRLRQRLHGLFGEHLTHVWENLIFLLILVMTVLIFIELWFDSKLTNEHLRWLAWADLFVCIPFLIDFAVRLVLVPNRWQYLRRHFLVDLLAAIPFGFLSHIVLHYEHSNNHEAELGMLLLSATARYIRVARPIVRIGRLVVFALRAADQVVRRNAALFNVNIVLFERDDPEANHPAALTSLDDQASRIPALLAAANIDTRSYRQQLFNLRDFANRQATALLAKLEAQSRLALADEEIQGLQVRVAMLPPLAAHYVDQRPASVRELRIEEVIEDLLEATPESVVDQVGQSFVQFLRRALGLFNVPGLRQLPVFRELVAYRHKGSAEAAALTANLLGRAGQVLLEIVYWLADLWGTISGPLFLERLGTYLKMATEAPAKRLLIFGSLFVIVWGAVWLLGIRGLVRDLADLLGNRLGVTVLVLGGVCLLPLLLGLWLRHIAAQASEDADRFVEAQFANQTKCLKGQHERTDWRFLAERVIAPELELRACDDRPARVNGLAHSVEKAPAPLSPTEAFLLNDEMLFLHNLELLYQDYRDGAMFHRSDTRTTMQLLGNLALTNLRNSSMEHARQESRLLRDLSLSRGSLLGGPFLWFNYINRLITQETYRRLIEYNEHAIPLVRLACCSESTRRRYQLWLARRLRIEPDEVILPARTTPAESDEPSPLLCRRREGRLDYEQLETVDFTAVDFLITSPRRDAEIRGKYGAQLAQAVTQDRQRNVRRAFRSFPLHEVPLVHRTFNPYKMYETYLAEGRVLLLPLRVLGWLFWLLRRALGTIIRLVRDVIQRKDAPPAPLRDGFAVAKRKIHRMRKPVFLRSLWLRAEIDIEYVGLTLPGLPAPFAGEQLLERDLRFINANRRERTAAERLRAAHQTRLRRVSRWLTELGWDFPHLPAYLEREYPYLADRAAEVLRALVTAFVLDHDDTYTLAMAIRGLRGALAYAANPASDLSQLPANLPDPLLYQRWSRRRYWHVPREEMVGGWAGWRFRLRRWFTTRPRKLRALLQLPEFARFATTADAPNASKRIALFFLRHSDYLIGWMDVVLDQGGPDPVRELRRRLREVMIRSDLWSDQILALRTIQSLTMLDVYHYCEMAWKLGGYEEIEQCPFGEELPSVLGPMQPNPQIERLLAELETGLAAR